MAANKFATILHRKTNKLTLILIYAVLEWILIILLLLNSLFSYIIIKFADYVGLKRPCFLCTRLDYLFEPGLKNNSYLDLVCEVHADEISKLGHCSNHRKLAESQDMCLDCSSSSSKSDCTDFSKEIVFFSLAKQIGVINGEVDAHAKCSCCGISSGGKIFSPDFLIKPSWEVLGCNLEGNLTSEAGPDDKIDHLDRDVSNYVTDKQNDEVGIDQNAAIQTGCFDDQSVENRIAEMKEENSTFTVSDNIGLKYMRVGEDEKFDLIIEKENDLSSSIADLSQAMDFCNNDALLEIRPQHLEFVIDRDDYQLIPVECIDSITVENQGCEQVNQDCVMEFDFPREKDVDRAWGNVFSIEETVALLSACEHSDDEGKVVEVESMECETIGLAEGTQAPSTDGDDSRVNASAGGEVEGGDNLGEGDSKTWGDETDAEVSIGTEIPEHEPIDEYQNHEECSVQCLQEDPSTSCAELRVNDHGSKDGEEEFIDFKTVTVETSAQALSVHLSLYSGLSDIDEYKVSDTPTSIESLQKLYKKLPLLEKRELGTEGSWYGNFISEMDYGEGILTVEKFKSVMRAERKAFNALHAELEEERSASAVAANQTMTMINRLQEEKAAMQMEALQYQRMMDEQSEYDQEALQLLNELLVKREKENLELEKDLEIYRRKVRDYEAKERMTMSRKDSSLRSRTSSAYCSNAEDSDGLSIDLNQERREESGFCTHNLSSNNNTPTNAVSCLEESLDNFEEERLQILEQLKVLEEKLFTLSDEEDRHFEDIKAIEANSNGYDEYFTICSEVNGLTNGYFKEMNGELHIERKMDLKAKRLLPLFNEIDVEAEDKVLDENDQEFDYFNTEKFSSTKLELENKKLSIEEEVDHVYERLQALEADREFLKHCMISLTKGDKGIHLLQEILQHLRELRNVEHRVRNTCDGTK